MQFKVMKTLNILNKKIVIIETDFGADYTTKLHSILNEHSSALKPLVGLRTSGTKTGFRYAR